MAEDIKNQTLPPNIASDPRMQAIAGYVAQGVTQILQNCMAAIASGQMPQIQGVDASVLQAMQIPIATAGSHPAPFNGGSGAYIPNPGLKIPTFQELIDAYEKVAVINRKKNFKPCERAVRGVVYGMKHNCELLKLKLTQPMTDFTYEKINEMEDIGLRQNKSRATIQGWRSHLKSITASWALPLYKQLGYDVRPYETSQFNSALKAYAALPKETVSKIDDWILHLDDDRHHRNEKIFVWIMRNLGVRNGDVFRLTWGNFTRRDDGKIHSSYVPNKTSKSSLRRANWDLEYEKWMEIGRYKPKDATDDTKIITVGELVKERFQRDLNKEFKKLLPPGRNKGLYELRKLATHEVYVKYGKKMAVKFSGDSFDTLEKNYVDTSMDNED